MKTRAGYRRVVPRRGHRSRWQCQRRFGCAQTSAEDDSRRKPLAQLTLQSRRLNAAPPFVVVFASGDGGLRGASKDVMRHLIAQGFWVAAFSSPEAFKGMNDDGKRRRTMPVRAIAWHSIIGAGQAGAGCCGPDIDRDRRMSRGANVVVAAAGDPSLSPASSSRCDRPDTGVRRAGQSPTAPWLHLRLTKDDQGRLQTYPALERLGSLRLAVIQSTNDSYVRSSESRRLLRPDTSTRRLYEVESKNHSFGGGQEALMRSLDDAMTWIDGARSGTADAGRRGRTAQTAQRSRGKLPPSRDSEAAGGAERRPEHESGGIDVNCRQPESDQCASRRSTGCSGWPRHRARGLFGIHTRGVSSLSI